jgi:hypothetical protein
LLDRISDADLIIYGPGTQHSSLLPSYLTEGLGSQIAKNLHALKILVTNIEEDVEIPDLSAAEIIERALYYLREKDRLRIPTPCLITHYLLNDAEGTDRETPYVPIGPLEMFEDPRLVRIANYEDGLTGRHHAGRVLTPFIQGFLQRGESGRVAIVLLDTESLDKVSQTVLEAFRAGLDDLPLESTFFYCSEEPFDPSFTSSFPFSLRNVRHPGELPVTSLLRAVRGESFDYVVLFESSGMYMGEDIVNLTSLLAAGRLDAVWGSRRLSAKDVRESYKLRYRRSPLLGAASWLGSHLLSLTYLFLYGRYVSDVLSGARVIRASYLQHDSIALGDKCLNQHLLSALLRDEAEVFEAPVQFFSMSPEKVKRTTIADGMQALRTILTWRFGRR